MIQPTLHSFHIPVMGLGFTIDTPVKVAHFGISSVMSIVEDELVEQMRSFYCNKHGLPYTLIADTEDDFRAKRITAYLNVVKKIVDEQVENIINMPFAAGSDINKYFELLPEDADAKKLFLAMIQTQDEIEKRNLQEQLRKLIVPGAIDVNLMSKIDKNNYTPSGELLPPEYSDAIAALRGFANSNVDASIVFSAGYNPRLYSYIEKLPAFFPTENAAPKKKIILKVSDYRSALTQGKILAKKGVWISEFRIESGLNCGGHAFATEGLLLGPILEEFKNNKAALEAELFSMCNKALEAKQQPVYKEVPAVRITVQGGIGTANENKFLLDYYQVNSTGWGSPFLLVPEVTNVDEVTLNSLATAKPEDYYLSNSSPLGVPFNSFRKSTSEMQRLSRIEAGRPGSPCTKKCLISNTEFSEQPICTASRKYQNLKINQLKQLNIEGQLDEQLLHREIEALEQKDCLCEGLGSSALLCNDIAPLRKFSNAVSICPGPNLAYFSGIFTLRQMVDFIYGRTNILNAVHRSNMFINELRLYVTHFKAEISKNIDSITTLKIKQLKAFKENLLKGIEYYQHLSKELKNETSQYIAELKAELAHIENTIQQLYLPEEVGSVINA